MKYKCTLHKKPSAIKIFIVTIFFCIGWGIIYLQSILTALPIQGTYIYCIYALDGKWVYKDHDCIHSPVKVISAALKPICHFYRARKGKITTPPPPRQPAPLPFHWLSSTHRGDVSPVMSEARIDEGFITSGFSAVSVASRARKAFSQTRPVV